MLTRSVGRSTYACPHDDRDTLLRRRSGVPGSLRRTGTTTTTDADYEDLDVIAANLERERVQPGSGSPQRIAARLGR